MVAVTEPSASCSASPTMAMLTFVSVTPAAISTVTEELVPL